MTPRKNILFDKKLIKAAALQAKRCDGKVIMFVPATKPCFYKMWSLIAEARRQKLPHIILNTGQHYDALIGHGMQEFGLHDLTAINLNIRGDLSQKSAELFTKMKQVHTRLQKDHPGVEFVPYVNGDTLTAGILPMAWLFASNAKSIQGEAGLRSMAPASFSKLMKDVKAGTSPQAFIRKQWTGSWQLLRDEPFPEQLDTFVSAAGCETFFAPVRLNARHLIREGYPKEQVHVVGNTVVDAIAMKRKVHADSSVFDVYPALESGEWLRVDIHRRGNLTGRRFKAIIEGIETLVKKGHQVSFIELNASRKALEAYDLRKRLVDLAKREEGFLFTPLWKEYGHVIEFLLSKHGKAILTDSGSMQEEANELGVPCMTARLNTDRPETIKEARSNILVPPVQGKFFSDLAGHILNDDAVLKALSKGRRLYGNDVAKKIVDVLPRVFKQPSYPWAHQRLGLWKKDTSISYL